MVVFITYDEIKYMTMITKNGRENESILFKGF